jgi:hypothetical protein
MAVSPRTSTDVTSADSDFLLLRSRLTPPTTWRLIFLRGIVWSLIGVIYAPLFTGLVGLLEGMGYGLASYVMAAGVSGGIGAVLYGAREVSLLSTGLGVVVGVVSLILFADEASFLQSVAIAAGLAALIGLTVPFPARCSRNVPAKAMAGLVAGLAGGAVLAVATAMRAEPFPILAVLVFLVSINGTLYVATVRWWVELARRVKPCSRSCFLIESAAMAVLAGVAAGSVWMVTGPLLNLDGELWQTASLALHQEVPRAIVGGLFGGGIAGMLLEGFRVSWVHDL